MMMRLLGMSDHSPYAAITVRVRPVCVVDVLAVPSGTTEKGVLQFLRSKNRRWLALTTEERRSYGP